MAVNYRHEARRAAIRHGLDPSIFERQINAESGFNPHASSGQAFGIAQFTPDTARGMGIDYNDPIQSLDGAARLMHGYLKKYGNYADALTAYNAGPGRVGRPLYAETRNYIAKILGGHNVKASASATMAQKMSQPNGGTDVITTKHFDQAGFDQANKQALLAQFLSRQPGAKDNTLLSSGLLSLTPPNRADYTTASTSTKPFDASSPTQLANPARGAVGQGGVLLAPHGGWGGSQGPVAGLFRRFGKPLGLMDVSSKRNNTNPYSGSHSDHDFGNKDAYAIDASNGGAPTPQMDEYAYRVMHALGFHSYMKGQAINTAQGVKTIHGLQYQVIYRGSGAAYGGNHLNHVHIGVHRVRK